MNQIINILCIFGKITIRLIGLAFMLFIILVKIIHRAIITLTFMW